MSGKVDLDKLRTPKVVECTHCNKLIGKITVKTEQLTENRIGSYFLCDKCGYKYPFAVISEKGQKLLKKIKRLKSDLRKFPSMQRSLDFALQEVTTEYRKEVTNNYTQEDVL